MSPPQRRVTVLVDVDETLCVADNNFVPYQYHAALITTVRGLVQLLKAKGVRVDVLLFTAQRLSTPSFVYTPQEEPLATPSRLKLLKHLREEGVQVGACVTTPEPAYNSDHSKVLGCFYADFLHPWDEAIEREHTIDSTNPQLLAQQKEETEMLTAAGRTLDKGVLLTYTLEMLRRGCEIKGLCPFRKALSGAPEAPEAPEDSLETKEETAMQGEAQGWTVVFFDDKKHHLREVEEAVKAEQQQVELCNVLIKGDEDVAGLTQTLSQGLEPLLRALGTDAAGLQEAVNSPARQGGDGLNWSTTRYVCFFGCALLGSVLTVSLVLLFAFYISGTVGGNRLLEL